MVSSSEVGCDDVDVPCFSRDTNPAVQSVVRL